MKYHHGALIIGLLILFVCIVGCSSTAPPTAQTTPSPSAQPVTPTPTPEIKLSTIEPSEMALQLSDVPADFTIKERSERTRSDILQSALDDGWKKGYNVVFQRINVEKMEGIIIQQKISVYPPEKLNQVLNSVKTETLNTANETIKIDELSDPKIGDSSIAFREREAGSTYFVIMFFKKDVYEQIATWGSSADYESLKEIATTAAAKIK
jgi:hypothetical protein